MPFERIRISCEGGAYFCCFQREQSLGNLTHSSLEEIWFGELAEEVRKETLAGSLHQFCLVNSCPAHFQRRDPAAPRKTTYPAVLEIDLPDDHCNIGGRNPGEKSRACIMCDRDDPMYKLNRSTAIYDVLPRLRPLLPHLKAVHIQGLAEAFWEDAIFRVLDLLEFDAFREKIQVCTFTNGILLNRARRKRFLERCPKSMVSFSLDAGSPETYIKIRRQKAYPLIVSNLVEYARERKNYPNAGLRIHNNINVLNLDEVVTMVRVAAEAEVDQISFCATVGSATREIQVSPENAHLFREAQERITAEAKKLGVKAVFLRPLDEDLVTGTRPVLPGQEKIIGYVDGIDGGKLSGWVRDPKRPGTPLEVIVFADGKRLTSGLADGFRSDIEHDSPKDAKDAYHAFSIDLLPFKLREGSRLSVKVLDPMVELERSPLDYRVDQTLAPRIPGRIDCFEKGYVGGWAWDPLDPAAKLPVEIIATGGGRSVSWTVTADQPREDIGLRAAGNAQVGFRFRLPLAELPAKVCEISVRIPWKRTRVDLPGTPLQYVSDEHYPPEGHLDFLAGGVVGGWAWDPVSPERKVEIEVSLAGLEKPSHWIVRADQFRQDLKEVGIGDGEHGFRLELPAELVSKATSISARVREQPRELYNSPVCVPSSTQSGL
jgi:hypothetical protein